jgi:SpoVK/Ycf46/Vps4 family AAA+-type ATPase
VQLRKIDPATVNSEKRRVVTRERVLEWLEPLVSPEDLATLEAKGLSGLDWVGGLENLKSWLMARTAAYTPAAREYGLPAPKGILVVGIPGCGKTLLAKACAAARKVPLLKLDIGGLKSKFVGESEANLRKALKTIEAIGPCVVLIDEIEKALQGATSGSADGGVSSDALGTILSWMQDRTSEAFVIATANDVTALPPELLRKGRFDELWFVDLPNIEERVAILEASLRQFKRDPDVIDVNAQAVARATEGFTGSEIASLIPDAMFVAFADGGREIETKDVLAAARTVTPLSKTADAKVKALKDWGATRARPATAAPKAADTKRVRVLDIA